MKQPDTPVEEVHYSGLDDILLYGYTVHFFFF